MIVSASYRTDIPAYYAEWFENRLAAGQARVRNPYGGKDSVVDLSTPAVDGFVFWTRNAAPFARALESVAARGTPFVVQYTVTGYPQALERAAPPINHAIAQIRRIANRYDPKTVVWRYDPLLISDLTPPVFHRENVARLADALAGVVDEVALSFAHPYRKTRRNLDRAAKRGAFSWSDPSPAQKRDLLAEIAEIARARGIAPTLCAQPDLLVAGLTPARCIDADRLSAVAGRAIKARTQGNRPGCYCAQSRDIGAYDSCPQGCAYCYAVADPDRAAAKRARHDPTADTLS